MYRTFSLCTLLALAGAPFVKKAAPHPGQSNTLKPFLLLCFMVYNSCSSGKSWLLEVVSPMKTRTCQIK